MTTTPKHDDIWYSVDRPILMEIASDLRDGIIPTPALVGQRLGVEESEGHRSGERLADAGYVQLSGGATGPVMMLRERGLREVGLWPEPESVIDRLRAVLEQQLVVATPEHRPFVKRMLDGLADLPQQVGVGIGLAFLGGSIGS